MCVLTKITAWKGFAYDSKPSWSAEMVVVINSFTVQDDSRPDSNIEQQVCIKLYHAAHCYEWEKLHPHHELSPPLVVFVVNVIQCLDHLVQAVG